MLVVGGGGRGRGHDGVGGDNGGAQAGRHRGAGGRRQGQPLTTSTGLLATPAFFGTFLVSFCFGIFPLFSWFGLAYCGPAAWRHRVSQAECAFKCWFKLSHLFQPN